MAKHTLTNTRTSMYWEAVFPYCVLFWLEEYFVQCIPTEPRAFSFPCLCSGYPSYQNLKAKLCLHFCFFATNHQPTFFKKTFFIQFSWQALFFIYLFLLLYQPFSSLATAMTWLVAINSDQPAQVEVLEKQPTVYPAAKPLQKKFNLIAHC